MKEMPKVMEISGGGKAFSLEFEDFFVKAYIPETDLNVNLLNYGFRAPFLLWFANHNMTEEEIAAEANENGMAGIAASFGCGIYYIFCKAQDWSKAPKDIYEKVIEQARISQYYKDGMAIMWNRFEKKWGDYYLRGTVSRAMLYGKDEAADYIAGNCLKEVKGQGMFGPGDISPVVCTLENISELPKLTRRDLPVVSVGNSSAINEALRENLDYVYEKEEASYVEDFKAFTGTFRRMVGFLETERDYEKLGMCEIPSSITVETSSDNQGDDLGSKEHEIGYFVYYNKELIGRGKKLPLVLCFHGGGDSAMFMGHVSGWPLVAHKHNFILAIIENHLNSTATEMMDLIQHLKEEYPIDEEKIYASGFSMGGCKSWDMFQEYPEVFAGVAPMDATFEVGLNVFGKPIEEINEETIVPVYYVGGEETPLPELPFQAEKCTDRMRYTLHVNQAKCPYDVDFEKQDTWENRIFGVSGDRVIQLKDESRGSVLTLNLFESVNGCCYSIFGCVSKQQHEVRHHTCENAWIFLNQFRRLEDGSIEGGKMEDVIKAYQN